MKKSEIGTGRFYSDGKQGVREVIDAGPQYKLYAEVQDDDCLRYRILNAKAQVNESDREGNSTRTAFAAWAKQEIHADQVSMHLTRLQAEKIAGKLTDAQRIFLLTFDTDLSVTDSVECPRSEHRAAKSCHEKGIIDQVPSSLRAEARQFEVTFTSLGLAVIATIHGQTTKSE